MPELPCPGGPSPSGFSHRPGAYRVVLFAAAVAVGVVWLAPKVWMAALSVIGAVAFGLVLDVPVSAIARRGVSRGVATVAVVASGAALLGAAFAWMIPTVLDQYRQLDANGDLGEALTKGVNEMLAALPFDLPRFPAGAIQPAEWLHGLDGRGVLESAGQVLAVVTVAVFAAIWGVAQPQPLADRLLSFVPPDRRGEVRRVSSAVLDRLRAWLAGQLVLCATVGLATFVLLTVLGVPFAVTFAVLAAVLEVVPNIGILLAAAGPLCFVLVSHPTRAFWLVAGIVVIHQLEDRLLIPTVMRRAVDIPQALLLLVMFSFGLAFGALGVFVALPVTVAAFTIHDELARYSDHGLLGSEVADDVHDGPPTPEPTDPAI